MDLATRKHSLETRRALLMGHMAAVETALDETPSPDWEDRASERQGDEVLERLGLAEQGEVQQIDAALARIEDGSYGFCVRCSDPISEARLDLLPATPFCKSCAR